MTYFVVLIETLPNVNRQVASQYLHLLFPNSRFKRHKRYMDMVRIEPNDWDFYSHLKNPKTEVYDMITVMLKRIIEGPRPRVPFISLLTQRDFKVLKNAANIIHFKFNEFLTEDAIDENDIFFYSLFIAKLNDAYLVFIDGRLIYIPPEDFPSQFLPLFDGYIFYSNLSLYNEACELLTDNTPAIVKIRRHFHERLLKNIFDIMGVI